MSPPAPPRSSATGESAIAALRRAVAEIDYICTGTVLRRTKVCGKAACRCASDPRARHGPYYEWTRREKGRYLHTVLPPDLGPRFVDASKNYRRLQRLLKRWEKESVRALKHRGRARS